MKRMGLVVVFVLLAVMQPQARRGCAGASPAWTTTPDLTSVAACVAGAAAGDTINVTAGDGTETWTTYLNITKGINLIGPGAASLTITNANTDSDNLIYYDLTVDTANDPFRISGFTFDMNRTRGCIYLYHSRTTDNTIHTKIRIDHNVFLNLPTFDYQAITVNGQRGVIDHNTFTNMSYPMRFPSSNVAAGWWDEWEGVVFGKADNNMYVEDNTFTLVDSSSGGGQAVTNCQYSNRYVFRYNTINQNSTHDSDVLFDMHGNAPPADNMYSCFGGEVYGNLVNISGVGAPGLLNQRGGKTVVFYNYMGDVDAWGIKMTEEYCDALNPTDNPQPQHVSDSYNWSNYKTGGGTLTGFWDDGSAPGCGTYQIAENQDWWNYTTSFNGTAGVGCGTLAARPATCTTGVGYWATDQSCSTLTGFVGASHTSTIAGTLYKCTATNTWTSYFTPYTYPHPLRMAPAAPINVQIR